MNNEVREILENRELSSNEELMEVIRQAKKLEIPTNFMILYTLDLASLRVVTYKQAKIRYGVSETKMRQMANNANALCRMDRTAMINTELMDEFIISCPAESY